ncbi:LysE family translocator ['Paenibacillus yunnanensis' Narsing Rao et al. 2020]|uniref:LysE family translocator n=1 Tax=Paenibacillus tengchongensis TaxID=2608684 RepID=UPI00124CBEB9|nr:LysE family translocator [Paenibacillus tengchongensis]
MPWEWMAKGMLLGLSIAAPVGPISILCIRKTIAGGFRTGLSSGLGAATADAVYGTVAGLGLSALTAALLDYSLALQVLGGLFICYLGLKSLLLVPDKEDAQRAQPAPPASALRSYTMTFLLTLSNPMTILFFLGVFGASGILLSHTGNNIPFLVGGVFLGSAAWWILLAGAAALFRSKLLQGRYRLIIFNKLSGVVLLTFGVVALVKSAASFI